MKHNLNKSYLLGLSLLSSFLIIWLVGITNWENGAIIDSSWFTKIEHRTRLHSLYLWSDKSLTGAWMNVFTWRNNLDVINWIIVWSWLVANGTWTIWWWVKHNISAKNTGIWWWNDNLVSADNSFIGWWLKNRAIMGSNSVVVWWNSNWAYGNNTVIVWWEGNIANNWWVIIWWKWNWTDYKSQSVNSLVFWWEGAKSDKSWTFTWNGNNDFENSAYIKANWVVIWGVDWVLSNVPLYVSWSVKIWDSGLGRFWEIKLDSHWCIRWNDNGVYQTFGRASWWGDIDWHNPCWSLNSCQFGSVYIQDGEEVLAYNAPYSYGKCSKTIKLKCDEWQLSCNWEKPCKTTYYVACHDVDSTNPVYRDDPSYVGH